MAKSRKNTTDNVLTMPTPTSTTRSTTTSYAAISARAYELYCSRGCHDGHDVEDWLQAERELQGPRKARSTAPRLRQPTTGPARPPEMVG